MLEKTLESPLDLKEVEPVNPKGNQSWKFIEKTDPEAPEIADSKTEAENEQVPGEHWSTR